MDDDFLEVALLLAFTVPKYFLSKGIEIKVLKRFQLKHILSHA